MGKTFPCINKDYYGQKGAHNLMVMELCAHCNDVLPAQGRCGTCKLNWYHRKKLGLLIQAACQGCLVITRLFGDGSCKKCLKAGGLRQCVACKEVKLVEFGFRKVHRGRCKDCLRKTRKKR